VRLRRLLRNPNGTSQPLIAQAGAPWAGRLGAKAALGRRTFAERAARLDAWLCKFASACCQKPIESLERVVVVIHEDCILQDWPTTGGMMTYTFGLLVFGTCRGHHDTKYRFKSF